MLQKLGKINDLPEELINSIPKLKNGEVVIFQSLLTANDYHPITEQFGLLYPTLSITFRDTIRYKDEMYPIGIVKEVENGNVKSFAHKAFGIGEVFNGRIVLTGGNFEDEEIYMFMMLSNRNANNPNRDKRITAQWKLIDTVSESKSERKNRNVLADALNIAIHLNIPEIKDIVSALGQNEHQEEDVLRNIVENYAESNPELFLKDFKNPAFKLKTVIKRAADKGFIIYDASTKKVKWADAKNTVIATLEENKDWLTSFAEYCLTAGNGEVVIKALRKKLKESSISSASDEPEQE